MRRLAPWLWELWCLISVVGIWPRWIEPRLLRTTRMRFPLRGISSDLDGLRIVQFSDLHVHPRVSQRFLDKLSRRIMALNPDIIVFTGDFVCHARMNDLERLETFLNGLDARYGCFASLGNHDYARYVSYDGPSIPGKPRPPLIVAGFKLLFGRRPELPPAESRERVQPHPELVSMSERTPFQLLENRTVTLEIRGARLNVTGVGDLWAGQCRPEQAFEGYDAGAPGIVLCHNPDGSALLHAAPGELILSGHTHGGQVNLPWMWKKITLLENPALKRGRVRVGDKTVYVNRGVGAVFPFRWFSVPELLEVTLEAGADDRGSSA